MKHNPDDRRNNVARIQRNINNTLENIDAAEEKMALSDNEQERKDLKAKNKKRQTALDSMRHEIRDEAIDREKMRND